MEGYNIRVTDNNDEGKHPRYYQIDAKYELDAIVEIIKRENKELNTKDIKELVDTIMHDKEIDMYFVFNNVAFEFFYFE